MNIRGKEINPWKYLVLVWAAHNASRIARAFLKARRLARRPTPTSIVSKFGDL